MNAVSILAAEHAPRRALDPAILGPPTAHNMIHFMLLSVGADVAY